MKSCRAFILSCLAAALLILPASAQAWVFQITDTDTGITTTSSALNFNIASTSGKLSSSGYTFTVLSDYAGKGATALSANMTYLASGLKNSINVYDAIGSGDGLGLTIDRATSSTGGTSFTLTSNTLYYLDLVSRASVGKTSAFSGNISISTVDAKTPIPAAALLLGSGFLGLIGLGKTRRNNAEA